MYKKKRDLFYILFNLKAACGLAYRPQAAFAFDRDLLSSQLLMRLCKGGTRWVCAQQVASTGGAIRLCLQSSQRITNAMAPAQLAVIELVEK